MQSIYNLKRDTTCSDNGLSPRLQVVLSTLITNLIFRISRPSTNIKIYSSLKINIQSTNNRAVKLYLIGIQSNMWAFT